MEWATRIVNEITRGEVHALLKGAGFKKHGRSFALKTQDMTQVLHFQSSKYSGQSSVQFTVNVCVRHEELAKLMQWPQKGKTPSMRDCQYRVRVGELLDVQRDFWWVIEPQMDAALVRSGLAEDLKQNVLPHFAKLANWEGLRDEMLSTGRGPMAFYVHLCDGDFEAAYRCYQDKFATHANEFMLKRAKRAAAMAGLEL